jgi:hypothetical protein
VNDLTVSTLFQGTSVRDCHLAGDGPDKGGQLAGDGHHDLVSVLAPGHQPAVAFAKSHLCFPANILNRLGHFFQSQLQVAANLGRIAVGPRAFNESPAGMGVPGLGDRPLATPLPMVCSRGMSPR